VIERRDAATAPRIDVIGVRSSWLTDATNWVFMRSVSSSFATCARSASYRPAFAIAAATGSAKRLSTWRSCSSKSRSAAALMFSTPSSCPRFSSGTHIALDVRFSRSS
jgi:hypothetical protein